MRLTLGSGSTVSQGCWYTGRKAKGGRNRTLRSRSRSRLLQALVLDVSLWNVVRGTSPGVLEEVFAALGSEEAAIYDSGHLRGFLLLDSFPVSSIERSHCSFHARVPASSSELLSFCSVRILIFLTIYLS
ncbi:uncharacterized protein BO97DRAFT_271204 [Aspergillus homomorphus CBS 101889]|uniref:Uncharacterized protein n=1 Tax=Aspergillus homomorphus (strain CBS 101889) TaxID=1450537 RepID=A0A395I4H6_ASPHC|nr:hypothetical protein BO97DRAFT_271204 [Aspergillus homomorphus CBS 101889]RAL14493.1 hypothetical protein BO97DRAFT_271204 [Aspergillus homomorphus CBS 101889]